jgi:hypothetical protein
MSGSIFKKGLSLESQNIGFKLNSYKLKYGSKRQNNFNRQ